MQVPSRFPKRILTVVVCHKKGIKSELKYILPKLYVFIFIQIYNMAIMMKIF